MTPATKPYSPSSIALHELESGAQCSVVELFVVKLHPPGNQQLKAKSYEPDYTCVR